MFWKRKKEAAKQEVANLARYIAEKAVPRTTGRDEAIFGLAERTFKRGSEAGFIELEFIGYGLDLAMIGSLTLAGAIEEATSRPLTDIEYADCYLCSLFIMLAGMPKTSVAVEQALEMWGKRFDRDIDYLVFADQEQLSDLTENGWERFSHYHEHPDAKLPAAYLYLLSKVVRQRRNGSDTPYADLDAMSTPDVFVFGALESAVGEKYRSFPEHWEGLANRIREAANEHEIDVSL